MTPGGQAHREELRGELRQEVLALGHAPDHPDHRQDQHHHHREVGTTGALGRQLLAAGRRRDPCALLLHCVAQRQPRADRREQRPHRDAQSGAGDRRQSGDALGHDDAERVHPARRETDLRRDVGDQHDGDRVQADAREDRQQQQHERNGLLAHAEDRAAEREQHEQAGNQDHDLSFVAHDESGQRPIDGAGAHQHAETPAEDQQERDDADGRAELVAGDQALERQVQQADPAALGEHRHAARVAAALVAVQDDRHLPRALDPADLGEATRRDDGDRQRHQQRDQRQDQQRVRGPGRRRRTVRLGHA